MVPVPVRRETELGLSATVAFVIAGVREELRLTLPAKLLRLASVTVKTARVAWGVVVEAGLVVRVKSGLAGSPVPATWLAMVVV